MVVIRLAIEPFCSRWLEKAEKYRPDSVEDCVDKFFTLFVAYNALYSDIYRRGFRQTDDREKNMATENVAGFLESQSLLPELLGDHDFELGLENLCSVLEDGQLAFSINKDGVNRPHEDKKLLRYLAAPGNDKDRVKAALLAVYFVRCNTFHGSKELSCAQLPVFRPLIIILQKTVEVLLGNVSQI